tara:strand:+ start:4192 stop:4782 length:591 start_codon:yes stop_codon:yes gene_type:complete
MKSPILLLICTVALTSCQKAEKQDSQSLFNGKDLTGWTMSQEDKFLVEDGVIKGTNDGGKGDVLLTEKNDYKNFIVELEFKLGGGNIDSGVFLRDTKEQIQIGVSGSLKKDMTAQAFIPGKGYPVQVDAEKFLKKDGWNKLKIKLVGSSYTTWLNGEKIIDYDSDTISKEPGTIGLQVHPGREMSIYFRNIFVMEL